MFYKFAIFRNETFFLFNSCSKTEDLIVK